jgi:hypothetical protein
MTYSSGKSNDTINSIEDKGKDVVKCGIGDAGTAYVDKKDWVKENCENVYLLIC